MPAEIVFCLANVFDIWKVCSYTYTQLFKKEKEIERLII